MPPGPRFTSFVVAVFATATCLLERPASAQDTRSFVALELDTASIGTEGWFPIVGLGATRELLGGAMLIGGQGDLAVWPGVGVSGRIGPLVQVGVLRSRRSRTFLISSYMFGLEEGLRIGAGVEVLPLTRRVGGRLTAQRQVTGDSRAWLFGVGFTLK